MNALMALLLFLSGACSLIYQTTWLREFRLVFGASTAASAAVLAIFMGGLGVGSWLLGKRAERAQNPLRFYACLELLIAALAALSPVLLWLVRSVYLATGGTLSLGMTGATLLRLVLATLVMGVPAFCMGGTLPAMARAATRATDLRRCGLATLYGMNALGAVCGVAVSTFFLFERFGNDLTLWLACLVNTAVALTAFGLARIVAEMPRTAELSPASPEQAPAHPRFVYAAAAVAGFTFLLMELVWYRMLAPVLGGSTYTFGLILMMALFGIGAGSALYAVSASRRVSLNAFAFVCALEALGLVIPYALGDRIAALALLLQPLATFGLEGQVFAWAAITAIVVLPASLLAGYQFPMLISLLGAGNERIARQTGLAYAWNTVGAIAGSLAGGFGLLPLLTAPGTWRLAVAVLALLSAGAVGHSILRQPARVGRSAWALGILVMALCLLGATGPTAAWRHSPIGAGREELSEIKTRNDLHGWAMEARRELIWEADGIESSVAAVSGTLLAFLVNGKVDGSAQGDASTQVMLGLLGAVLHPDPQHALVVGLGTGSTAGWLADVPSIQRVDVVELEPAVIRFARMCDDVNRRAMDHPKVNVITGDAREIVQVTRQQYDVIASEPSNPYRLGIAGLFTREFYRSVVDRLRPGGIFVQWVQGYEVDAGAVRTICATLHAEFPEIEVFRSSSSDLLFVASLAPLNFDVTRLRAKVAEEPYQSALAWTWRTGSLEGLLGRYVGNVELIRLLAGNGEVEINTDDRTILEFAFGRSVGRKVGFEINELHALAQRLGLDRPKVQNGEVDWSGVLEEWITVTIGHGQLDLRHKELFPGQFERTQARNRYAQDDKPGAVAFWKRQSDEPGNFATLSMVADLYVTAGDEAALPYLEKLKARFPAEAGILLADLRAEQGLGDEAVAALAESLRLARQDPWIRPMILKRAFELAVELGEADSTGNAARMLHNALNERFSGYMGEIPRLTTRLALAEMIDGKGSGVQTLVAFEALEPYPKWERMFLKRRADVYCAVNHPFVGQAQQDLEDFRRDDSRKLADLLGAREAETEP